jgi:hypothetical protein
VIHFFYITVIGHNNLRMSGNDKGLFLVTTIYNEVLLYSDFPRRLGFTNGSIARVFALTYKVRRIVGVGVETADMLVHEVLSRPIRYRRAVARYAGLTGAADEGGSQRLEQGLARAGNARVRRGMIQLAWRSPMVQKESVNRAVQI